MPYLRNMPPPPQPTKLPNDISEISSESIKKFSDLYEKEELISQKRTPEYQTVPGGDGDTYSKRLYTSLLITLGALVLLGIGILVLLNYLLIRVSRKVYETRLGTLEDDEENMEET